MPDARAGVRCCQSRAAPPRLGKSKIARGKRYDMTKSRVGYIGVGLMGHGAAKNILEKGHPLTVMGHRNRAPVDELVGRGAKEAKSLQAIVAESDVVFTCMPSSVEVEAAVFGPDGLLAAMRPGMILVDSTTADPNSTRRIG